MGEGNVERSKIRIVAIDRTPTSETDGLGETHAGLPLPEFSTDHVGSGSGKSPRILLFDRGPSFRPDLRSPSRRAQWRSRMGPSSGPPPSAARSVLDGREHDGSIVRRRGPRSATRTDPAIRKLARRVIKKRAHAQPRAVERPQESDAAARGRSLWTHLGKPGRGGKICQLRFLKRQLVLPVSMMSQWWVRRSSMAVVILASPKTWGQSAKARLVVISSEVFS